MTDAEFMFVVLALLVMLGEYTNVCLYELAIDHDGED